MADTRVIDLNTLIDGTAGLSALPGYLRKSVELSGERNDVVLTGSAPVRLYPAVAHAVHGEAKKLIYRSPVTGEVVIFGHDRIEGP